MGRGGDVCRVLLPDPGVEFDPWQEPPCCAGPAKHCDPDARKLLEQMLAAGVSRWHPDPMAALAEAKEKCGVKT